MDRIAYIKFGNDQLEKIGNTVVYLSEQISFLSKTKLLKLLYILDELSVKKSGIPFVNLTYKVWKFGPVSEELFIDLSSETSLLAKFISNENAVITAKKSFDDSEFSDNDIELMNFVIEKYGNKTAKELVAYTHRKNAPWYETAVEKNVLELLGNEEINNTEYVIDLSRLIMHDPIKNELYRNYIEVN